MKLQDGKYQTATQVNVLSPVITNVKEADSFHMLEGNMIYFDKVRNKLLFRGLRQWYDIERKLYELGRTKLLPKNWIYIFNPKKRENIDGNLVVGLIHSKGVVGVMSYEVTSHLKGLALLCRGKRKQVLTNELEEACLQN